MGRGATEFDSLEGWLGHKARGGSGGKFLSKWKTAGGVPDVPLSTGHCDTWMHTARLPMAIWRHGFPMFVVVEDKDTKDKVKHVYSKKFVCHEDESVLEHPWRDKETGEREKPPKRCGLCKFDEWCWQECQAWVDTHEWDETTKAWKEKKKGKSRGMDPCTLLFDFESEADDDENTKLYIGGICNFFGQKDLDDDIVMAMKKAKIRGDLSWQQNAKVRCEYVLCVVDNDNINAGVQIAVEAQALGEKIKEVIQKVFKSDDINIQKTPYCIQWIYKKAEQFSKKYDATQIMKIKPSERVLKLVRGEAPNLDQLKEPFNQTSMRATLEKHCLEKSIPWDEFFPTKEQESKWKKEDAADDAADEKDEEDEKPKKGKKAPPPEESDTEVEDSDDDDDDEDEDEGGKSDADETAADDEDDEMVACDNPKCKKPHPLSAAKCPHCGHAYEVEEEPKTEPEPEAPKVRSRSEVAKAKAEASAKKKVK